MLVVITRSGYLLPCGACPALSCHTVSSLPSAQVFDVRMAPRMLSTIPFSLGPTLLQFHPRFSGTLLVGSGSGLFTLADVQGGLSAMGASMYQVCSAAWQGGRGVGQHSGVYRSATGQRRRGRGRGRGVG